MNEKAASPAGDPVANIARVLVDRHVAEARGHRNALRFGDKRYSFHDLAAIANRTGNMLKRAGVAAGHAVLVALPPSPALAASILGAMKIGAVPVALPADADLAAMRRALANSQVALIVAHQDRLGAIEAAGAPRETIVAVGQDTKGYRSFVDLVREEPSSLSAETVAPEAPALGIIDAATLTTFSHADLDALIRGDADVDPAAADIIGMLRALAKGEEHALA